MTQFPDFISPVPGTRTHGYRLIKQELLESLDLRAWQLVHERTGARHLHLQSTQGEKTFVMGFRTLPEDHSGVAHILEHSVLEGSKAYPVHLFRHLSGRSLYTYLNAMTSSDHTFYPFASTDDTDYRNLMSCYLDACFHPLLKDETFLQEGWRLENENPEDASTPLQFKGVVFNEMKAALANPDGWFHRVMRRELFPEGVYSVESGGIPAHFPELDVHGLREFHERHYHPSNSWCITFGDQDPADLLAALDRVFADFESRDPVPFDWHQTPWSAPRRVTRTLPVAEGSAADEQRMAAVGWRLPDTADSVRTLELGFLFEVIAGNLSAPLNKRLLECGLGSGLAPAGFNSWGAQSWFGAGLKGIDPERVGEMEDVIDAELRRLEREGIESDAIEAVLDRWEFELRNTDSGRSPWGLSLSFDVLAAWMNGSDPFELLHSDEQLEQIRLATRDPRFLPTLIRTHLLENPERLSLVMLPEAGGSEREQREEDEELARRAASLDDAGRAAILEDARRVKAYRDDPQDLSCLPDLDPALISREARRLPVAHGTLKGAASVLRFAQPTNGIVHLRLALSVDALGAGLADEDLLSLLPRFSLAGRGIEATARRIQSVTGGIGLGGFHGMASDGQRDVHRMLLSSRCLERRLPECIELLEQVLFEPDLDAPERLRELCGLVRSNLRGGVVSSATSYVNAEALALVSPMGRLHSLVDGIEGVQRVHALDPEGRELGEALRAQLERVFTTESPVLALAGSAQGMDRAQELFRPLLDRIAARATRPAASAELAVVADLPAELKAWITDVNGAFVAEGMPAPAYTDPDAPLLFLLTKLMVKPLYTRIRAEGGAYGAAASYLANYRSLVLLSWRDPRIAGTLDDYRRTREELVAGSWSAAELKEARIAALRQLDSPVRPGMAAGTGLSMFLLGQSDTSRDAFRAGLLDCGDADLKACATRWLRPGEAGARVVLTTASQLASEARGLSVDSAEVFPDASRP